MNELRDYVDGLFRRYGDGAQLRDLRAEILANLEARRTDLIAAGMSDVQATQAAKESLTSVDGLIDGNRRIYINRVRCDWAGLSLIVLLAGWIVTIPLLMFHIGAPACLLMALAAAATGLYYLWLSGKLKRDPAFSLAKEFVNLRRYKRRARLCWLLWGVFAAVSLTTVTALHFGSNLWFSRGGGHIDGPYALAVLLVTYFVPLLTVVIPLIAGLPPRLIPRQEAEETDENA